MRKFGSIGLIGVVIVICSLVVLNGFLAMSSVPAPDPFSGVLIVNTDDGQGSCVVVAQDGEWTYALTAAHGVAPDMVVDAEAYEAESVRVDTEQDLALIRFKSPETYMVYDFSRPVTGEACTTVGWYNGGLFVYMGNVVAVEFEGHTISNTGAIPGLSGGALLNKDNEIIGITIGIFTYGRDMLDSTAIYVPARYAEAMVIMIGD